MGSDKISNLEVPLLRLSLALVKDDCEYKQRGTKLQVHPLEKQASSDQTITKVFELDKNELSKFITSLEEIEKQLLEVENQT